jgi:hypothetical protein
MNARSCLVSKSYSDINLGIYNKGDSWSIFPMVEEGSRANLTSRTISLGMSARKAVTSISARRRCLAPSLRDRQMPRWPSSSSTQWARKRLRRRWEISFVSCLNEYPITHVDHAWTTKAVTGVCHQHLRAPISRCGRALLASQCRPHVARLRSSAGRDVRASHYPGTSPYRAWDCFWQWPTY